MDFIESMALAGGDPALAAAMRTSANKQRPQKSRKEKPVPVKPSVPAASPKKEKED